MVDDEAHPKRPQMWLIYLFCIDHELPLPDLIEQRIIEFNVQTAFDAVSTNYESLMQKRNRRLFDRSMAELGEQIEPRKKTAAADFIAEFLMQNPEVREILGYPDEIDGESIRKNKIYPRK